MILLLAAVGLASTATAATEPSTHLDSQSLTRLIRRCAPQVHPKTMLALIRHESAGQPYVIGVNTTPHQTLHPPNASEATRRADALIKAGRSVDLGLGQINAANLEALHLTTATAFDPCRNIAAAAKLLTKAYVRERPHAASAQAALSAALSRYNTGTPDAGIANGYVAAVRRHYAVPALQNVRGTISVSARRRRAPAWDVYRAARQPPQASAEPASDTSNASKPSIMVYRQTDHEGNDR